jgi:hypothetical protein
MTRWSHRMAAAAILFIAGFEIFGCALCSGETCQLQGTMTHQSHQASIAEDQWLCCCGHLLVASAIHVEPVSIVTTGAPAQPIQPTIDRHTSVYHPPRA